MSSVGSRAFGLDVSAYVVPRRHDRQRDFIARDALSSPRCRSVGVRGRDRDALARGSRRQRRRARARGAFRCCCAPTPRTCFAAADVSLYRRLTGDVRRRSDATWRRFDIDGSRVHPHAGHSTDHQVVWDPRPRTLFSGDLWLGVRSRAFHSTEDPYAIIESLRRVAALEPERHVRRASRSDRAGRRGDRAQDRLAQSKTFDEIARRIAEGWSDATIVKRVLGGERSPRLLSRRVRDGESRARGAAARCGGTVPTQ